MKQNSHGAAVRLKLSTMKEDAVSPEKWTLAGAVLSSVLTRYGLRFSASTFAYGMPRTFVLIHLFVRDSRTTVGGDDGVPRRRHGGRSGGSLTGAWRSARVCDNLFFLRKMRDSYDGVAYQHGANY